MQVCPDSRSGEKVTAEGEIIMLKIGCHLSASAGFMHMAKEILSIGGNTFQFFTRNPRGGTAKPLDEADAAAFQAFAMHKTFLGVTPLFIEPYFFQSFTPGKRVITEITLLG